MIRGVLHASRCVVRGARMLRVACGAAGTALRTRWRRQVWTRHRFYLAIHPSWFVLLTFGMLGPKVGATDAYLAPGFCPIFGQVGR